MYSRYRILTHINHFLPPTHNLSCSYKWLGRSENHSLWYLFQETLYGPWSRAVSRSPTWNILGLAAMAWWLLVQLHSQQFNFLLETSRKCHENSEVGMMRKQNSFFHFQPMPECPRADPLCCYEVLEDNYRITSTSISYSLCLQIPAPFTKCNMRRLCDECY